MNSDRNKMRRLSAFSFPKQRGNVKLRNFLRIWSPRRICLYYVHRVLTKIKMRINLRELPVELLNIWRKLVKIDQVTLAITKQKISREIDKLKFGDKNDEDLDVLRIVKQFNYRILRAGLGVLFNLKTYLNFKQGENFDCKTRHCAGTQEYF